MAVVLIVPAVLWTRAEGTRLRPRLSGVLNSAGDGAVLFLRTLALRACLVANVVLATHMGVGSVGCVSGGEFQLEFRVEHA